MSERPSHCEVCGKDWGFVWTDTHGVGQCIHCGACYTIFHYGVGGSRVDKPPEFTLNDVGKKMIKDYHEATGRPIPAQVLGLSFEGGQSAANQGDIEAWNAYRTEQKSETKGDTP